MDAWRVIRSAWTVSTTVVYTILLGIPTILVALVSKTGRAPYRIGKFWSWLILKTNRVKLVIQGRDKLINNKSYVLISNHLSQLDVIAVLSRFKNPIRFVAKKSLASIPVFGWASRLARMIFIDRGNSSRAIAELNKYIQEIKNGISAYFFAEGTRSADGTMRPFKKGGVLFALKAKLPIVPVTIINTDKLLPRGDVGIRSGEIRIILSDPIDTEQYSERNCDELLLRVQSVIRENLSKFGRLPRLAPDGAISR